MFDRFKWPARITATSSIAHGGEPLGTVTYLRRERFLSADGLIEIPVISGNAWRGLLRRTAADLWWEAAGRPKLTTAVMHAIWSGGALAKSSGSPITGGRVQEVRRACPVIALFGASGGGRILDGSLQVGKMLPICQETLPMLPRPRPAETPPSLWDLTQIEYFSKIPSVLEHRDAVIDDAGVNDPLPPARFGVETFVMGTQFSTWLAGEWLTDLEMDFLLEALEIYGAAARVGGYQRMGMGSIDISWEGLPPRSSAAGWRSIMGTFGSEERGVLAWLD
jgi:hypothetical protein